MPRTNKHKPAVTVHALLVRLPAFWLFWGALTEGEGLWTWGLVAAAAAALASLSFVPPSSAAVRTTVHAVSLTPLLFLEALISGWDVALRALSPKRPLAPDLIDVPIRGDGEGVAIAVAYVTTVMPGTLAVEITREYVRVHVIDRRQPNRERVTDIERRLETLAGQPNEPPDVP